MVLNREIAVTKTTREGNTRADASDYICEDLPQNYKCKLNEDLNMNSGVENTLNKTDLEKITEPQFVDSYNERIRDDGVSGTIQVGVDFRNHEFVAEPKKVKKVLRVRKLTPKEVGRLMGVADEDIDAMAEALTPAQMFYCFGDSIVTTCLMGLFGTLFDVDYQAKITELIDKHIREAKL